MISRSNIAVIVFMGLIISPVVASAQLNESNTTNNTDFPETLQNTTLDNLTIDDNSSIIDINNSNSIVYIINNTTYNVTNYLSWETNIKDYGAVCDGITDDSTAIQSALDDSKGGTVIIPGRCAIAHTIISRYPGQIIEGTGRYGKSALIVVAPINAIQISGTYSEIKNLFINGNGIGQEGIVLHNAAESTIENVLILDFQRNGTLIDSQFSYPTGSNNNIFMRKVVIQGNMYGVSVPVYQSDNNALRIDEGYINNNRKSGILYKGDQLKILGGNYEDNGEYGIQVSELNDTHKSSSTIVFYPWMEGNGLGGYRGGGQSEKGMISMAINADSITNALGSYDTGMRINSLGIPEYTNPYTQLTASSGNASALPSNPLGYLTFSINNIQALIPYYGMVG